MVLGKKLVSNLTTSEFLTVSNMCFASRLFGVSVLQDYMCRV